MNANAKYPAWVFELYARYFELLAPGEEALSIDEYAEPFFKTTREDIKRSVDKGILFKVGEL